MLLQHLPKTLALPKHCRLIAAPIDQDLILVSLRPAAFRKIFAELQMNETAAQVSE